jgi:hypothetical protein
MLLHAMHRLQGCKTQHIHIIILPHDGVTIDGVWTDNRIYWIKQLVITLHKSLSHKD